MKRKVTKKLTVGTLFLGVALAGSVAFAAWTATGSGNGYAQATSAQALTTVNATTSATLYPGATGDVFVKITNPNPYQVTVTAINGNGAITSDKGAACDASTGLAYTNQTGSWVVAGGATTQFTLSGAVAMSNASDTTCQGAIFTIPVTLSGASS